MKVSLGGVRDFPVGPFQASVLPGTASSIFQKVRASLHDCLLFFFITYPGIVVTPRLFWSNSVGIRVDFTFLPQLKWITPISQWRLTVRTLLFGRMFAKFEDLGVVQVCDQLMRFCPELVDLPRLAQILNE